MTHTSSVHLSGMDGFVGWRHNLHLSSLKVCFNSWGKRSHSQQQFVCTASHIFCWSNKIMSFKAISLPLHAVLSNCTQLKNRWQQYQDVCGHWGERGEASFIMHACLRVMSPWYSQSPEFPLAALIKAAVSALAEKKDDFINDLINHQNSPSTRVLLLFILSAHHSPFSFLQSLTSHTHTHTHTNRGTHTCSF